MYRDRPERIVATIEARMTSSRLPGKVMMPLAGVPALGRMVERVRRSQFVDEIVVATTVNPEDDAVDNWCTDSDCSVYRGSENDVLGRVLNAARGGAADIIVELTGDCPMIDPVHIDKTIECFFSSPCDYASNILERTLPDGLDVQVFPLSVLEEVDRLTRDPIDRVHVSYYIYTHPQRFRLRHWKAEGGLRWPELRLTLDEKADYELLDRLFGHFELLKPAFSTQDVIDFLRENPEWYSLNANVRSKDANEG